MKATIIDNVPPFLFKNTKQKKGINLWKATIYKKKEVYAVRKKNTWVIELLDSFTPFSTPLSEIICHVNFPHNQVKLWNMTLIFK